MDRYTNHRRTEYPSMKNVTGLKNLKDGAILVFGGFGAVHGLMEVRIESFAERLDPFGSEFRQVIQKLLVN